MSESIKIIVLDGSAVADETELHAYLRRQMSLPEYYGDNLDALYDVLTDLTEPAEIQLQNRSVFAERMGWYGRQFLRVLDDAAEDNCYLTLTGTNASGTAAEIDGDRFSDTEN